MYIFLIKCRYTTAKSNENRASRVQASKDRFQQKLPVRQRVKDTSVIGY